MAKYLGVILGGGKSSDKGSYIIAVFLASNYYCSGEYSYYYEKEDGFNQFKKDFPYFSEVSWQEKNGYISISLTTNPNKSIDKILHFRYDRGIAEVTINGETFQLNSSKVAFLEIKKIEKNIGLLRLCDSLILFPAEVFATSYTVFSSAVLEDALRKALGDSDLVKVVRDCPYIPIKSLNGKDGAIYKDGEFIYLDKIGKTFKVLGSFHIVRDTDLNLVTCYALGDKEPSLILPEVVLSQLKGGG